MTWRLPARLSLVLAICAMTASIAGSERHLDVKASTTGRPSGGIIPATISIVPASAYNGQNVDIAVRTLFSQYVTLSIQVSLQRVRLKRIKVKGKVRTLRLYSTVVLYKQSAHGIATSNDPQHVPGYGVFTATLPITYAPHGRTLANVQAVIGRGSTISNLSATLVLLPGPPPFTATPTPNPTATALAVQTASANAIISAHVQLTAVAGTETVLTQAVANTSDTQTAVAGTETAVATSAAAIRSTVTAVQATIVAQQLTATALAPKATPVGGYLPQNSGTYVKLTGVSCPSISVCITVGEAATIEATGNAGATWFPQADPATSSLRGVQCVSITNCQAVGDVNGQGHGVIIGTTDEGGVWTAESSNIGNNLLAISCGAVTSCVAVGTGGIVDVGSAITGTNNVGLWTPGSSGTVNTLNAISCSSASNCVAVGDNGESISTSNGGANWSGQQNTGIAGALAGIACLPAGALGSTTCYAVGASGRIIKTTNGGANWTSENSNTNHDLTSISCTTTSECRGIDASGSVLTTTDSGATWVVQSLGTTSLFALASPSESKSVLVGNGGIILAQ